MSGGDETSDFISDEPPFIDDTDHAPLEPNEDGHVYVDWSKQYKQARLYLFGDEDTPPDFAKAYDLFLLEAENGNALAMHDLGRMFADGLGRDADADTAYQWYEEALAAFHIVEEENPKLSGCEATNAPVERSRTRAVALAMEANADKHYTQYRIGKMYNAGLGTEQNYEKAARWFAPAADGGNKYAQYSLGSLYYKGNGVVQNYETALTLYAKSDMQNFPYASYELAKYAQSKLRLLMTAVGTTKNIVKADVLSGCEATNAPVERPRTRAVALAMEAKADKHFKKAFVGFVSLEAQSHDDKLQYRIGQMLLTGTGTEKDIAKATEYFEKSARLGNSLCCESVDSPYQLAKIYLADETADLVKIRSAIAWLTKSAEGENQFAQYALGKLCLLGEDIPKDIAKAITLLIKSAEQQNQFAQYQLGKVYLVGEDTPKNIETALQWLGLSAEQGNQYAQYTLGKLYLMGKDVEQDRAKALEYFTLSAAQGNIYAQFFCDNLLSLTTMNDFREPSVMLCTTRLLHHLSNVFQDKALPPVAPHGMQIDCKQRRKTQEKKVAQGHAQDDRQCEHCPLTEQTMG